MRNRVAPVEHLPSDLTHRLESSMEGGTAAANAIAGYMLANLQSLPFETAASLGSKIGVSEASIGRFCRGIGFPHLKALKGSMQSGFSAKAWLIGDKLREFHSRSRNSRNELSVALEREIAAVMAVYEIAATPEFDRFVARLARCPAVYVAGLQTERGHAVQLVHNLQYLRPDVYLADVAGGHFAEILLAKPSSVCLVLIDGRRYSRTTQKLAEAAHAAGIPVTLITDPYCGWARGIVSELFAVPTDINHFWDSTSAMASLVSLTVNGVFKELGAAVEARMERVSSLYNQFTGHTGGSYGGPATRRTQPARKKTVNSKKHRRKTG